MTFLKKPKKAKNNLPHNQIQFHQVLTSQCHHQEQGHTQSEYHHMDKI